MLVTTVTARAASSDGLSDQDYQDIFEELRKKTTLRGFVELLGSEFSIAYWSKVEGRKAAINRQARQELRRAVGLAELPPTVGEALAAVDPDATVYRIGEGRADRVVMVGAEAHEPLTLALNGELRIVPDVAAVTAVTGGPRRERGSIVVGRELWERLNEARGGRKWEEFLSTLMGEGVKA